MAETLRGMPGVKSVGISEWALLQTGSWNGNVSVNGNPATDEWAYFLAVSPGWMDTMKIRLVEGREITAPGYLAGSGGGKSSLRQGLFEDEPSAGNED